MTAPGATTTHTEVSAKRIRAVFAGETIADSTRTTMVWEHPYYPNYYFPRDDVRTDLLAESDHRSTHEDLGQADHFTIQVGDNDGLNAAWRYPDSPVEAVRELIRFDWGAMDRWYEEDEQIFVHPRNPYARIDILDSRRHIQVEIDGVMVADSIRPKLLFETHMPTRYYLPKIDVRFDLLTPSDTFSQCPYKGVPEYWSADVDGVEHRNIVWSYPSPVAETAKIAGLMCFYNEKLDITVDGVPERLPQD